MKRLKKAKRNTLIKIDGVTLDKYQSKVYKKNIDNNEALIIQAVAGAGKSTTMIYKAYRYIVKDKVEPEKILLTTFSNKSARDLKNKFKKVARGKITGSPIITTIHSFGIHIIKKYLGNTTPIILSEWKSILLIREIADDIGLFVTEDDIPLKKKEQTVIARKIYEALDYLKSNMIINSIDKFKEKDFNIHDYKNYEAYFTSIAFNEVAYRYEKQKEKLKMYDYHDLVFKIYSILVHQPTILKKVKKDLEVFIIDEAQDLDSSQWAMLLLLAKGKKLIAVGDKMQNIYNFRYSVPHNFTVEYLSKHFKKVHKLPLVNNYRSTKNIVNVSNLVRKLYKDELEAVAIKSKEQNSVKIIYARSNIQEGKLITDNIKRLRKEGYNYKDITIICRSNSYIKTVVEPALVRDNLPYNILTKSVAKKLTDKVSNQIYFNILSLIVNPNDFTALADLSAYIRDCGEKFQNDLTKQLLKYGDIRKVRFDTKQAKYKLDKVIKVYQYIFAIRKNLRSVNEMHKALDVISYLVRSEFKEDILSKKEQDTIEKVITNWVNYYAKDGIVDVFENLNQVLFEIDSFDEDEEVDKVKVGTIHSQKGLDNPVSIVSGFNTYKPRSDPLNDECNMLYVQLSRAVDKLIIIVSDKYVLKDGTVLNGNILAPMKKILDVVYFNKQ